MGDHDWNCVDKNPCTAFVCERCGMQLPNTPKSRMYMVQRQWCRPEYRVPAHRPVVEEITDGVGQLVTVMRFIGYAAVGVAPEPVSGPSGHVPASVHRGRGLGGRGAGGRGR